jgi:RluA family pseudouridine synthase
VAKPKCIEFDGGKIVFPIVYEDRSVMALDKLAGWMLAPDTWDQTGRNLQLALQSSLNAGDYWARSRNLKYLRFIHRLDAETTGLTLFAKSPGALRVFSELFEERRVEKRYLAAVHGLPKESEWTCDLALTADPIGKGRMMTVPPADKSGKRPKTAFHPIPEELIKDAETHFRVLQTTAATALVEARPTTGRTHQIRVHLAAAGHPVIGDAMYGKDERAASAGRQILGLRAVALAYDDPFQGRRIRIEAPVEGFLREYGFKTEGFSLRENAKPPSLPA